MAKKLYGTDPDQVPTNADLGTAAYADTQNMPETRLTNQPLSAKFGAEGDVPTDLASTLDFMQIGGSTFVQTGSDAQAFIKSNHYWNGGAHSFVDTGRGSTTIRLNENNGGIFDIETAPSGGTATLRRFRVDEDGNVTTGYSPMFLVHPSTAQNNINTGSVVTVAFGTEVFDAGNNFASNTFTAPVQGKYFLSVTLRLENIDTAADFYEIKLTTSNRTYQKIIDPGVLSSDPNYFSMNLNVVADMDASDTAYVGIYQPNGTSQTDINGLATNTYYSGFLIG